MIDNYHNYLVDRFGTRELTKDEILVSIVKNMSEGQSSYLTNSQILQLSMLKKDNYQKEIVKMAQDKDSLQSFAN